MEVRRPPRVVAAARTTLEREMSSKPTRPLPYAGMPVRVVHLGLVEPAIVDDVGDGGRTLTVAGARYTLRRVNGRFVREDQPYYGVRLSLRPAASAA